MSKRISDGYYMEGLGGYAGSFVQIPTSPYTLMPEDAIIRGAYILREQRTIWADGFYDIIVYKQLGVLPSPASDVIIASNSVNIASDIIVDPN